MDIAGKTIWQQASGDTDRDYADVCLKWDVVLNGPGYAGPWPDCAKVLRDARWSARKVTDLRRFAERMKDDDFVVLRIGTATVWRRSDRGRIPMVRRVRRRRRLGPTACSASPLAVA